MTTAGELGSRRAQPSTFLAQTLNTTCCFSESKMLRARHLLNAGPPFSTWVSPLERARMYVPGPLV